MAGGVWRKPLGEWANGSRLLPGCGSPTIPLLRARTVTWGGRMADETPAIVGMGEVLWDLLPAGPQLGGAPFNFVFHCHQLGHASVMVSRVGADDLGRDVRAAVRGLGLSDELIDRGRSCVARLTLLQ